MLYVIARRWMYRLPHKLLNDWRLKILANEEVSKKSQNLVFSLPSKTKNVAIMPES